MEYLEAMADLIEVVPEATVSRTALRADGTRLVLFAFDAGQELTEHTAAMPVVLLVIAGRLKVGADGKEVELRPGGLVHLRAREPHAVTALEPSKLALVMLDTR